ncbi:hypothetical protein SAMN05444398_10549 [Roseovarius pacificus]|uniref:HEPN AbiU2-like domain-containing protein n=1 Tax=Roseovarius pacificus TaxID=337701 RepID=A0A1M7CZP8_9RHOB|nr:hypothetical protein [Roseovarius pacificus]GGO56294.1 hypothetical protein GCM10011315_20750 [Roseovarius pacificus]SHL72633.1 hypothetical protein SAMN05444398_10549 [Roseovarius pacificus]
MGGAKEYYDLLLHELYTARIEWRLYRSLFGTNKETVDLLNEISGLTAQTLERVLFERTLLNLRKLTDPYEKQRGKHLSVTTKGLSRYFDCSDNTLRKLVNQAERAASFARDWSNKRIAHSDLDYKARKAKLEKASRAAVEDALTSIADVLKWVAHEHFDTTLVTHPIPPLDDERRFLKALYLGKSEMERVSGKKQLLLEQRRYAELDEFRAVSEIPDWLVRKNPPIDV